MHTHSHRSEAVPSKPKPMFAERVRVKVTTSKHQINHSNVTDFMSAGQPALIALPLFEVTAQAAQIHFLDTAINKNKAMTLN